jgi:hypothetical protein
MITPVYKNIEYLKEFYLERALPNKGKLLVSEGEKVFSYTKVGYSKNAAHEMIIPKDLKFNPKLKNKKFIKSGDLLAFRNTTYLFAPFDGYLEEKNGGRHLIKHQEDFWLLSGISGQVIKVIPSKSCLIKTSGYKLKFFETSISNVEGELKVMPNPSELIELDFMQRYIKNGVGQVVYSGDYLRKSLLDKAIEIGCEGIICGSCDRETFIYAKQNNFFVGVLSGFGRLPTHSKVFELLKNFDGKYLIARENSKDLFISSENLAKNKDVLINSSYVFLKKGMDVISLEYPYFGWEAEVLNIESDIVNVRIKKNNEVIDLSASDLIALA